MHETMHGLHKQGLVSDDEMQEVGVLCIADKARFDGPRIRALRVRLQLSQARLASRLNTSVSTVRRWEKEQNSPSGPALQLLELLERDGAGALP
jgi:putative transcriptional regulator